MLCVELFGVDFLFLFSLWIGENVSGFRDFFEGKKSLSEAFPTTSTLLTLLDRVSVVQAYS